MTIQEIQDQITEEFSLFDDWDDKYSYIIELGKKLKPLDEKYKVEQNKIKGCQSQVWLISYLENNKVIFEADSDAVIVKGLVSLLIRILSGHEPDEIVKASMDFLDRIGLQKHLSPTRSNGLSSMVKQMKMHALAYKAKLER
jgi:cysteine desulfuration protein SufE